MGCGASINENAPATDEQKQTICKVMAKEAMYHCIEPALDAFTDGDAKIPLPPDFDSLKDAAKFLKKQAKKLRSDKDDSESDKEEKKEEKSGGGGMFGALASAAGGMLEKAMDAAEDVAKEAAATAMDMTREAILAGLDKVEGPMGEIAVETVEEKKEDLKTVLTNYIKASYVDEAQAKCKGEEPQLTEYLFTKCIDTVSEHLMEKVEPFLKDHKTIQAWDAMIKAFNDGIEKAAAVGVSSDKLKPIELDIKKHICDETAKLLAKKFAKKEKKLRKNPEEATTVFEPTIFKKVFGEGELLAVDYTKAKEKDNQ